MRGTLLFVHCLVLSAGIIPAHAGNTFCRIYGFAPPRDHPRACGEHMPEDCELHPTEGSSPRMRGTHAGWSAVHRHRGIIPAHAGNTIDTWQALKASWDHPRACGEHAFDEVSGDRYEGSSPRMRGTRQNDTPNNHENGIIPAHAGNTLW